MLDLRRAAAIIFALVGVLPLLLFVFFLWHFDLAARTEAQMGLFLALVVAVLGYSVFQRMLPRISSLARRLDVAAPADHVASLAAADSGAVAGLGPVVEIGELANAFSRMLADLRASTERLEDLVFKLGTLNEMVEMASKIPHIQDLLADVLERTMRAVHARIGSIMLLDRDRQTLKVVAARGHSTEVLGGPEVRVGEGVSGKAVQLGEPVLVEDIETDPRFGKPNDPKYGGGSFICMPLRVADRIIGVVNLAMKQSVGGTSTAPPFSRTDLQFLNTLMTYTAYAVDNARLLEEAQDAARKLNEVVEDQQLRLTLAQQQMIQAAKLSALGGAEIWADDHQLRQGLLNLVTNAKQALADIVGERRLRVSIRALDGERVTIVVEDNGPGIAPELVPTIFDPFVSTKGVRGTGLGLSISYGIVREHGGHIAVQS